jgi:hypothetical protein
MEILIGLSQQPTSIISLRKSLMQPRENAGFLLQKVLRGETKHLAWPLTNLLVWGQPGTPQNTSKETKPYVTLGKDIMQTHHGIYSRIMQLLNSIL